MTESYYDDLAPFYRFIYQDWDSSVEKQAAMLSDVILEYFSDTQNILDAACGIGTQSIGLASLGYTLTASDISTESVQRAHEEAHNRNLVINFGIADMRSLWQAHRQEFDLVIACDNAIPHLMNNADILVAFEQFYRCTKVGGGCLISIRDYSEIECQGQQIYPRQVHQTENSRVVLFDIWDFSEDRYEITTYVIEDNRAGDSTTHILHGGHYYCVKLPTLESLLSKAGFDQVKTLRDRFFQPLIIAHKN